VADVLANFLPVSMMLNERQKRADERAAILAGNDPPVPMRRPEQPQQQGPAKGYDEAAYRPELLAALDDVGITGFDPNVPVDELEKLYADRVKAGTLPPEQIGRFKTDDLIMLREKGLNDEQIAAIADGEGGHGGYMLWGDGTLQTLDETPYFDAVAELVSNIPANDPNYRDKKQAAEAGYDIATGEFIRNNMGQPVRISQAQGREFTNPDVLLALEASGAIPALSPEGLAAFEKFNENRTLDPQELRLQQQFERQQDMDRVQTAKLLDDTVSQIEHEYKQRKVETGQPVPSRDELYRLAYERLQRIYGAANAPLNIDLDVLTGSSQPKGGAAAPLAPMAAVPQSPPVPGPIRITNDAAGKAAYDALDSGMPYIAPDGTTRYKK
jgi:hypothetical protein